MCETYHIPDLEQMAANKHDLDRIDLEPLMPWSDQLPKNLRVSK